MKNTISYYYHLTPTSIIKRNQQYEFEINQLKYIFIPCYLSQEYLLFLHSLTIQLYKQNIPVHTFILNKDNQFITMVQQIPYILMQIHLTNNSLIIFNDILRFQEISKNISLSHVSELDWFQLWTKKIDYLEYQISEFGKKYPIIRESFSYYVGLSENAISILKDAKKSIPYLSHRRLFFNSTLYDLYNPLNFIVDTKVRDIVEYLKDCFFHNHDIRDEIQYFLNYSHLQCNDYQLLFARFLFPSYYFDCYEKIIDHGWDEKNLLPIILKNKDYEIILKQIYETISYHCQIPEIFWLKK